jgi:hypothetical protein
MLDLVAEPRNAALADAQMAKLQELVDADTG